MKIYMFHYVRDSKFNYYHFDIKEFENKIIELKKKYKFINNEELKKLIIQKKDLTNYIMFTFDDGTIDHYLLVYPILKKHNCSGLFFIPSSIFNKKILNVQILHQLLALDKFDEMYDFLISELRSINYSIDDIKLNNSLDNNNVALFKQLLQYILPFEIRTKILEKLMGEKFDRKNR